MVRWSADGRYSVPAADRGSHRGARSTGWISANGRQEPWKELKPADPVGVQICDVVMTPDGSAYAYSFQRDICTLYLVSGLK